MYTTNKIKKAERERAIKPEIAMREAQRAARSPIDRQQMISLISSVRSAIAEHGHRSDFAQTDAWLEKNNIDIREMHDFIDSVNISDDWGLLMDGDPFQLFGSSDARCSWMPLEAEELEQLLDFVDSKVREIGLP